MARIHRACGRLRRRQIELADTKYRMVVDVKERDTGDQVGAGVQILKSSFMALLVLLLHG